MPATVNGIGTMYYGRKNASARRGTCESCGRAATLTSYDTREFFTIIYIPIIPLTKYRIFDECSSCRRHQRLPLVQFEAAVSGSVEPLREAVRRTPQDPAAHEQLIAELLGLGLTAEAEEAARAAVNTLQNDAKLNLLAGQILAQKGDLEGAAAFMGRAVYFDSADASARLSLGRIEYLRGKYDEAIPHLEQARRSASNDVSYPAAFLLGESFIALQRWQDALTVWQSLATASADKEILRRIGICKKHLGYELHPAEKKAARSWWPFGKSSKPRVQIARVDTGAPNMARVGVLLAVIAVVIIGGAITYGVWKSRNINVHFDSFDPKGTFVVDGKRFEAETAPVTRTLSPGKHEVTVLDAKGNVIEKRTIDLPGKNFLEAMSDSREFVYNTGAMHVYKRAELVYTANPSDSDYKESLIGGEGFFMVEDIDYMFVQPPATLSTSSNATSTVKHALMVEGSLTPLTYGMVRLGEGKRDEARKVFRMLLEKEPCDPEPRELLTSALLFDLKEDEAVKVAREGVQRCNQVQHHRDYQSLLMVMDKRNEVAAEYRASLAANPQSAMHHYLYARTLKDPAESMPEYREAVRLDPNLGWAHAALAYELLGSGAYSEAMDAMAAALKTKQHDERAPLYYVYAAIAAGRAADARAMIPETPKQSWISFYDFQTNWLLTIAEKKWTAAESILERYKESTDEVFWRAGAQFHRLRGSEAAYLQHLARAKGNPDLRKVVQIAEIEDLYTAGKWKDAIALTDASRKNLEDDEMRMSMYTVAASLLDGDRAGANERIRAIRTKLAEKDTSVWLRTRSRDLLTAFDDTMTDEQVLAIARDSNTDQLKDTYFFLGARASAAGDAARAQALFRKSAETSFDLAFPMLAARRLGGVS